jgi:GT2 family glycosyltransferase
MNDEFILAAVINWNGWSDTLACLDSLKAMPEPPFHLLICDNGSSDESYERISAWARSVMRPASEPRFELTEGGHVITFRAPGVPSSAGLQAVYVMRLARNFGYAGAINRCIAWGRDALAPGCYWLLNNDVALDPQALRHLVAAVRGPHNVGLCGSVLFEWAALPKQVQAIGGMFHPLIATGTHLKQLPAGTDPRQELFFGIDYPVGASLLVTREYVESVGLMDEAYFLYYEEVDWAFRGRACGFRPAVALRSEVRHKEGASTKSSGGARNKSMLSEYYGVVNRLRFTGKFSPRLVPVVWLSLFLVVMDRVAHREWKRAALVLKLMLSPGSVPRPIPEVPR